LDPRYTFLVDGYLGATAGMAEMLLQSHEGDIICLMPALPSAWPDGYIRGLKARGDITVDIYWNEGKLSKAVLHARRAGEKVLVYRNESVPVALKAGDRYIYKPGR